jgi:hypothetical protein
MRELLVTRFLTLDGVMQAPGGPGEDDSGGFKYGRWSVNYYSKVSTTRVHIGTYEPAGEIATGSFA